MTHYRIGDVIANSMNPQDANFFCGSVKKIVPGKGYKIHFFDLCTVFISQEDAVPLRNVLGQYEHNDEIVADKSFIEGREEKIFVGGRIVSNRYGSSVRHCIKTPTGKTCCILFDNCIPAIDALRAIEPCPRSQNR